MAGFGDPAFYGDRWANVHDEHHGWLDPAAAVEFLARGTGRPREPQPGRLSTAPAAMARTSWAWSRSFWSAYRRANRPIAAVNFGPLPM